MILTVKKKSVSMASWLSLIFTIAMTAVLSGSSVMIVAALLSILFLVYYVMAVVQKTRYSVKILVAVLIFFLWQEHVSAQTSSLLRLMMYAAEVFILLILMVYALCHWNGNGIVFRNLVLLLCSLVIINYISTISVYKSLFIFALSTYDSLKYFILIFFVCSLKLTKEDLKQLMDVYSVIILITTVIALLQFFGNTDVFDVFRGRFSIVRRNGNYRAIGIFPHPIELGNYACVVFSFYYVYNKYTYTSKYLYLICACALLCAMLSGTRTAMVCILIVILLSNLTNVKGWISTIIILLITIGIFTLFLDIEGLVDRTISDLSKTLPRQYYLKGGIEVWKDYPLFGIGLSTFASRKYRERTGDIIFNQYDLHEFDFANLDSADSYFAQIIPELGVVGLVVLAIFAILLFTKLKHCQKYEPYYRSFFYVILTVTILAINSSYAFFSPHIGTWFWISCGMIFGNQMSNYNNEENRNAKAGK